VSCRWAVVVAAAVVTNCASTPRTPVAATRFGDTLVYFGELTTAGLVRLKSADQGTAKALLIRSGGGSVSVGMDFGEWVYERGFDVIVDDVCLSSCANYVFPAGRIKTILPGGLVAWHGNSLQKSAETDIQTLPRPLQSSARKLLPELRARERAFYTKVGVNECLDHIGSALLGVHGLFTMSADDMAKFGVRDIHGAASGEDKVSTRIRRDVKFTFVNVPLQLDASSACR